MQLSLNYLCHSIWEATTAVKSVAYKSLVRPLLEYACQVWNPHTTRDKSVLEAIQCCAARWACESRWDSSSRRWNKSSGECLDTLHWPTLTQRCNYLSVSTFFIRELLLLFQTTTVSMLSAPEHMIYVLCLCSPPSTATDTLFLLT